jgi:hypothetical protein
LWIWVRRHIDHPDVERQLSNLIETPDPTVETGTPVSLLRTSSWAVDLNRSGRGRQFRAIRRALDRPDLLREHEPYWVLQIRHRKAVLLAISHIARSLTISESSWQRLADAIAGGILDS